MLCLHNTLPLNSGFLDLHTGRNRTSALFESVSNVKCFLAALARIETSHAYIPLPWWEKWGTKDICWEHRARGRGGTLACVNQKYWSSPCHLFSLCPSLSSRRFPQGVFLCAWGDCIDCIFAPTSCIHHYSLGEGWAIVGWCLFVFFPSFRPICQRRWTSVLQVVLSDPLSRQLRQNVVQVIGVGVTVAGQVGAKFCLVVNLVPHNRVRLPRGAGCADGEDQASVPRCYQQLQDLVTHRRMQLFYNTTKKKERFQTHEVFCAMVTLPLTFLPLSLSGR